MNSRLPALLALLLATSAPAMQAPEACGTCDDTAGTYNAWCFGARPDDAQPDSAAFQAAFDCISAHAQATLTGATLVIPSGTYEITKTVLLPKFTGPLRIEGTGARLRIHPGVTGLAKPSTSMADLSVPMAWEISGIEFLAAVPGPYPTGRSADPDAPSLTRGIAMDGSYLLSIRQCHFYYLDVGIDLRFAMGAVVEECAFTLCRQYGTIFGSPAWNETLPCPFSNSPPGGCGSHHSFYRNNRHYGGCEPCCKITPKPADCEADCCRRDRREIAAILVDNTASLAVSDSVFEGLGPQHTILQDNRGSGSQLVMERLWLEGRPAIAHLKARGTGLFVLRDIPKFDGGTLVDLTEAGGDVEPPQPCSVVVENVRVHDVAGATEYFATDTDQAHRDRHAWSFRNAHGADLRQPKYWKGGRVPSAAVLSDEKLRGLPDVEARATPPASPAAGQLWFDTASRTFKYWDGRTTWVMQACEEGSRGCP